MRNDTSIKLKVVELAKETNNSEATGQYGINEKQVWMEKDRSIPSENSKTEICLSFEEL